jgi:hypothetical protein
MPPRSQRRDTYCKSCRSRICGDWYKRHAPVVTAPEPVVDEPAPQYDATALLAAMRRLLG